MPLPPRHLAAARRQWLAQVRQAHRAEPDGASALAQARAEWMCGDYDAAVASFVEARDRDPSQPAHHLALARCAAMLGLEALEADALEQGCRLHPADAHLALHRAARLVPGDVTAALGIVSAHPADPVCAQFALALDALATGTPPRPMTFADRRLQANWDGLLWAWPRASPGTFTGMPNQVLVRALQAAPGQGMTLECGVYFGRSLRLIAAASGGTVHGFDSFEGLPEAWHADEPQGAYSTGGQLPDMPSNVVLHRGWFEDTLPGFLDATPGPVRLLHVDCDIYSSTRTVLAAVAPRLVPGSVLVFDDFLGYPGYEAHELRAFEEFVADHHVRWDLLACNLLGRVVAMRITGMG